MRGLYTLGRTLSSEPAVFLYTLAVGIYSSIIPNFIHQKLCSPLVEPPLDYVCNSTALLAEATDITTVRGTLREVLPAVVLLLAGSWRDYTGRNKPIMYLSLIGELVGVSIELFGACRWELSPWVTSLTDGVLYGLAGGNKLFYVGALLVITDQSTVEDRTARMGLYTAALVGGNCVSYALSGYALEFFGYRWFFVLVMILHLLTLAIVISINENNARKTNEGNKWQTFKKLKAVFKSRPNNPVIWLMLLSSCLINTCSAAEVNLYLYYLQQGFKFTVTGAGVYTSYRLLTGLASSMASPPFFTKVLKWSDFKVGIISAVVTGISAASMAFAATTLQLALFAWFDFLKIFLFTVPKSIITKSVGSDEVGIFISLCYIGECLMPTGIFFIYDSIFSATSQNMPGAIFLVSAAVDIVILIAFSISHNVYQPQEDKSETSVSEEANDVESLENCEMIKRHSITKSIS